MFSLHYFIHKKNEKSTLKQPQQCALPKITDHGWMDLWAPLWNLYVGGQKIPGTKKKVILKF